jgi:hypothetical protein
MVKKKISCSAKTSVRVQSQALDGDGHEVHTWEGIDETFNHVHAHQEIEHFFIEDANLLR